MARLPRCTALTDVSASRGARPISRFTRSNRPRRALHRGQARLHGRARVRDRAARAAATEIWRAAWRKRVRPAGFVAADILRIEAGFVLFANEFRVAADGKREPASKRFAGSRRDRRQLRTSRSSAFEATRAKGQFCGSRDGPVVRPSDSRRRSPSPRPVTARRLAALWDWVCACDQMTDGVRAAA